MVKALIFNSIKYFTNTIRLHIYSKYYNASTLLLLKLLLVHISEQHCSQLYIILFTIVRNSVH